MKGNLGGLKCNEIRKVGRISTIGQSFGSKIVENFFGGAVGWGRLV